MTLSEVQAPAFEDPVTACPTDPVVIWNGVEQQWFMFYTQRRPSPANVGVSWVHGTAIAVASSDNGRFWLYRGRLDLERGHGTNTYWAPEVICVDGQYHMFVSRIAGVPTAWVGDAVMLHYVSDDLWQWSLRSAVDLQSSRVIDPCVYKLENGSYKMWYKDERRGSVTYAAVSSDLDHWEVLGPEVDDVQQEGPNVFEFGGIRWMISDVWHGLAVYRSRDFEAWKRSGIILDASGTRVLDQGYGHHADVVTTESGDAYIFYFCHPYKAEDLPADRRPASGSRPPDGSVIQAAQLIVEDGELRCDRNALISLHL